jgi:hypothetical protein
VNANNGGCLGRRYSTRNLAPSTAKRRAELIKAKVMTAGEDAAGRHQGTPLAEHVEGYVGSLEAAGACPEHRKERRRQLQRLVVDCGWRTLADLQRDTVERWLALQVRQDMGARTRNSYLTSAIAFGNWAVETGRLLANPFDRIPKADEKADPRRQRRAMTESELAQLLCVARERPLVDALTVRKGPRKGERHEDENRFPPRGRGTARTRREAWPMTCEFDISSKRYWNRVPEEQRCARKPAKRGRAWSTRFGTSFAVTTCNGRCPPSGSPPSRPPPG